MTGDVDRRLLPDDLRPRALAIVEFVAGHLVVQDELDAHGHRDLPGWIGLIAGDVGEAGRLLARDPYDPDAVRGAVAWLACACADSLRALAAFAPDHEFARRPAMLRHLEVSVVSTLMSEAAWLPSIEVAFVVAQLGELVGAASPIICADPAGRGPVPRFHLAVTEVLRAQSPELYAEAEAAADADEEPVDPVQETIWALEDLVDRTARAAVLIHPGGPVGMPSALEE